MHAEVGGEGPRAPEPVGGDLGAEAGELAVVRGEQGRRRAGRAAARARRAHTVRASASTSTGTSLASTAATTRSASSSVPSPGPTTQACTRPASSNGVTTASGQRSRTCSAGWSAPAKRTIPAPARSAAPTASTAAPVYCGEPAATPTTPRAYLSLTPPRPRGRARADVGVVEHARAARAARGRPTSTSSTRPACCRPAPTQQARLERPERHRHVGAHRGARHRAGVGVHPARHVDGDDRRRRQPVQQRGRRGTQRAAAADADQPVDDEVGRPRCVDRPGRRPPGRRASASATGVPDEHGVDPRAPGQQPDAGPQRVGAVVAAADEQQDAGAVDAGQQPGAVRREPGRGPLHQRAVRQGGEQRRLERADRVRRVQPPHASATTTAVATPPSCDSDRCHALMPCADASSATPPCSRSTGRPDSQRHHLGVAPAQPARGAERLGDRLLGGEPGRERLDRARLPLARPLLLVGEQPAGETGRAREGPAEPGHLDDVDPHAHDHGAATRP